MFLWLWASQVRHPQPGNRVPWRGRGVPPEIGALQKHDRVAGEVSELIALGFGRALPIAFGFGGIEGTGNIVDPVFEHESFPLLCIKDAP